MIIIHFLKEIIVIWKKILIQKNFRWLMIFNIIFFLAVMIVFTKFLVYNEVRLGSIIHDPILTRFNPIDLTWFTFLVVYLGIIIVIISMLKEPAIFVTGLLAYALMVLFRLIVMYTLPLEAPITMIPLEDPFVQLFGTGEVLRRDLFFSGHTATMSIMFLLSTNRKVRITLFIFTLLIAFCVIAQHVHYTVDVLSAPFFAFGAYKASVYIIEKYLEIKIY